MGGGAVTEPEVRVRSTRRRRSELPPPPASSAPHLRNWLIYTSLIAVIGALMLDGFLSHRPDGPIIPTLSQATEVRSAISQQADSLQIVVSWDLTLSDSSGQPDSIRVKVWSDHPRDSLMAMQSARQLADTLNLATPPAGQAITGLSCVTALHPGEIQEESCTPWQFLRPTAANEAAGAAARRIVVQPTGLQVDPDLAGSCARWQQTHPAQSVWIDVNRTAVPECTGPNRKPTVAQFCAFAVLPDGRRTKTANSANNTYCEELFEEWIRERFS